MKMTQMSTNWSMNKQNVVYSYNKISSSYKKEWGTDTSYNMVESWKHYSKLKKLLSDKSSHVL